MKKEHFDILKEYERTWRVYNADGTATLHYEDKKKIEVVYIALRGMAVNLYCNQCVIEMFTTCMRAYDAAKGEFEAIEATSVKSKRKRLWEF
jgi:hypothetical protein